MYLFTLAKQWPSNYSNKVGPVYTVSEVNASKTSFLSSSSRECGTAFEKRLRSTHTQTLGNNRDCVCCLESGPRYATGKTFFILGTNLLLEVLRCVHPGPHGDRIAQTVCIQPNATVECKIVSGLVSVMGTCHVFFSVYVLPKRITLENVSSRGET